MRWTARPPEHVQHFEAGTAIGLADHKPRSSRIAAPEFVQRTRASPDERRRDAEAGQGVRQQVDERQSRGGDEAIAGAGGGRDRQMHAAMPLAVQIAPTPASSAAIRSSSTAVTGSEPRAVDMAGSPRLNKVVWSGPEHAGRGLQIGTARCPLPDRGAGRHAGSGFRRQAAWVLHVELFGG